MIYEFFGFHTFFTFSIFMYFSFTKCFSFKYFFTFLQPIDLSDVVNCVNCTLPSIRVFMVTFFKFMQTFLLFYQVYENLSSCIELSNDFSYFCKLLQPPRDFVNCVSLKTEEFFGNIFRSFQKHNKLKRALLLSKKFQASCLGLKGLGLGLVSDF